MNILYKFKINHQIPSPSKVASGLIMPRYVFQLQLIQPFLLAHPKRESG